MELKTYQMIGGKDGAQVKAVKVDDRNAEEVAQWVRGIVIIHPELHIRFESFRGEAQAHVGDYILRDNLGETHVRKAAIFERVFSPIDGINGHDFLIDPS